MNYLKQKIRIHSLKKLILWLLVVPSVCYFGFLKYSETEQTQGFTIFLLVIAGWMLMLIIHALWLTLFPYHLREFKLLKDAYGVTPEMIEQSIAEDMQNGCLIKKKDVIITNDYCIVQTIRYTRIIVLSELVDLKIKHRIDFLAYLWWLPKVFLYVQEERRNYRVHMSKKIIFILCQRLINNTHSIELPKEFLSSIRAIENEVELSPMTQTLKDMNQQLFMNDDSTTQQWKPLIRFMLVSFAWLILIYVLSMATAIISPLVFFGVYILGAVIWMIIRIIQLFKVVRKLGGGLSIVMFVVMAFVLLILPIIVFNMGKGFIALWVG